MLYHGDCYEVLKDKIANDSIDLVVTDPHYDLSGSLGAQACLVRACAFISFQARKLPLL